MAGIKSTLDIIMEKTRNLSLSDDERQAQQLDAAGKKVSGLVQRFKDNAIRWEQFQKELQNLRETCSVPLEAILLDAIIELTTLDAAGKPLIQLLENIFGSRDMQALHEDFCGRVRLAAERRAAQLKDTLQEQHGIAGAAVKVNPVADAGLAAELAEIKRSFAERLQQEKCSLLNNRENRSGC